MTSGVARAQDDEDDKTFEEKVIDGIMAGIGGTNMDNRGIDYRERSPLVVPPKLDLPPPVSAKSEVNDPNWPKDPDEARRKAEIKARKKAKPDPMRGEPHPDAGRAQRRAGPRLRPAPTTTRCSRAIPPTIRSSARRSLASTAGFSNLFGGNKSESSAVHGRADPGLA